MNFYCTDQFKREYEKLKKKKSYASLPKLLYDDLLNRNAEEILARSNHLNSSSLIAYLKTRLGGSGGYRVYLLLVVRGDDAYLGFVHPKTGSKGAATARREAQKRFYNEITAAIENDDLYLVDKEEESDQIIFKKK